MHQLVAEFERLLAAGLTHATIAAPLAAGIERNAAYLVQEFVAAESLDIVVRDNGPASPGEALRLVTQVAGALDVAADLNQTHGALHPRDVLLSTDQTRVTGIGVARALEQVGVAAPVRRPYTAPERMAGASWDRRADVFSLAALLHEMLWGRRLAATGRQAADALTAIAGADLAVLRAAFARALAEDPADRFATAHELAAALKDAFPELATDMEPAPSEERRAVREPRLPLDESGVLEIRAAEPARYEDVEMAPATAPDEPDEPTLTPLSSPPRGLLSVPEPEPISALERSRSAIWPLALALVVGVALGFGAGYGVGRRDRVMPTATVQPTPVPAKEWTESAISEPPKATPAPAPVAPAGIRPAAPAELGLQADATSDGAGRLVVRSTPAGARVFVDGRDRGRTPATLRDLTRGAHRVRLVREGYATEERRIVITGARPAQAMTVALARTRAAETSARARSTPPPAQPAGARRSSMGGALSVDSRPAGAKVFVDGKLVGTTPMVLPQLAAGTHVVRLEHEGYRRWSSSVSVASGERNRVTASLER